MGSWSACPALIYDLMLLFWSRITLCIMFYFYSIFRECYSHGLHLFVCRVWRSCPIFIFVTLIWYQNVLFSCVFPYCLLRLEQWSILTLVAFVGLHADEVMTRVHLDNSVHLAWHLHWGGEGVFWIRASRISAKHPHFHHHHPQLNTFFCIRIRSRPPTHCLDF